MLKEQLSTRPEAVTYRSTQTLMDGTRHVSLRRCPERQSLSLQPPNLQTAVPLTENHPCLIPAPDSSAPVGSQTVFPSPVDHCADAASKAPNR